VNPGAALEAALARIGAREDEAIEIAEAALMLGALDRPAIDLEPYRDHLATLGAALAEGARPETIEQRARRINDVLYRRFGYAGDSASYDDPDNADLLRVIDRRVGLPVSLGILYIHLARGQGWAVSGLAFPGHFLVRLELDARRLILDPFHGGQPLEAGHLRDLIKQFHGASAELDQRHYASVSDREVLLRLLNNQKTRALQSNDPGRAATILHRMTLVAPRAAAAWRELGLIEAHVGNIRRAIRALETYLELAPGAKEAEKTADLVKRLKGTLN
jgi:regulator of sirC expression with transglutaminase-like and TPR domain